MKGKKKIIKRKKLARQNVAPRRRITAAAVYVGLSELAAKTIVAGLLELIKNTKDNPSLTLECVRVMANAVKVKDVTISDCQFEMK